MTEAEKKLCKLLAKLCPRLDLRIGLALVCREDGITEEIIDYIEANPAIDEDTLARHILEGCTVEIVDDDELDEDK